METLQMINQSTVSAFQSWSLMPIICDHCIHESQLDTTKFRCCWETIEQPHKYLTARRCRMSDYILEQHIFLVDSDPIRSQLKDNDTAD